jgi:ankyrin repeat protein
MVSRAFRILDRAFAIFVACAIVMVLLATVIGSVFRDRRPPLYFAAERGDTNYIAQCLARGANVNGAITSYKNGYRWAPLLHIAVSGGHPDTVALLLTRGADVNMTNYIGETPLHTVGRNIKIAQMLLRAGGNPQARDSLGYTPISKAQAYGYTNLLAVLTNAQPSR